MSNGILLTSPSIFTLSKQEIFCWVYQDPDLNRQKMRIFQFQWCFYTFSCNVDANISSSHLRNELRIIWWLQKEKKNGFVWQTAIICVALNFMHINSHFVGFVWQNFTKSFPSVLNANKASHLSSNWSIPLPFPTFAERDRKKRKKKIENKNDKNWQFLCYAFCNMFPHFHIVINRKWLLQRFT